MLATGFPPLQFEEQPDEPGGHLTDPDFASFVPGQRVCADPEAFGELSLGQTHGFSDSSEFRGCAL